jgi:hypothetical protein
VHQKAQDTGFDPPVLPDDVFLENGALLFDPVLKLFLLCLQLSLQFVFQPDQALHKVVDFILHKRSVRSFRGGIRHNGNCPVDIAGGFSSCPSGERAGWQ